MSKYESAPIAKRLFAAIMDAAVFIFVFFCLAFLVMWPIINEAMGYKDTIALGRRYQLASHLFFAEKKDDNDNYDVLEVKDTNGNLGDYHQEVLYFYNSNNPSFYINRLYYYYHNFKTGLDIELPKSTEEKTFDPIEDHFVSPDYKTKIDGLLPENYYTNAWFSENILRIGKEDSYIKIDTAKEDYLESIVLIDETKKDAAIDYLKDASREAVKELYYSDFYQDVEKKIEGLQIFMFVPSYLVSFGIFYFLFPLIFKDGETLGKKTMHIAVISFDGYKVKKRQIILRETLLLLGITVSGIVIGIGITSLATMCLGALILFVITMFSKVKRSPHDFASFTIVIDANTSVWFDNPEDEARHEKELQTNMSKYNKYVENKNLIQVGTEILDEDLKKEVEANKKKQKDKK